MKKSSLILLVFIALSCNNSKDKISIIKNKEEIENKIDNIEEIKTIENKPLKEIPNTPEISDSITYVATKFINDYVSNCNKMKEQIGIIEWVNSYPNVSQKFKSELTKMIQDAEEKDPEYGLGFDPIFDAQDYPDDGFKLTEFDSTSNFLTVEAKSWEGFTITMRLKEMNNEYLVDGCGVINIPKNKQAKR
ncbi:hypothetical protein [Mangrovimonas sp. YM274]|uniref:hypothetical protein n=1 Tax=Mangrovimonas sp. YM274 TaxID=3070660 RepID=UPI0027DE0B73|nr:hypothetical protein [Mangrovimonas sp. YM274]WMI70056.1 hypothetical protein RBH95_06830 [Mangrovimonas sp. YM274]